MKIFRRIIAAILTLVMIFGIIQIVPIVPGSLKAYASSAAAEDTIYTYMARIALNYNYNGAASFENQTIPNMRYNRYMNPSISSVARPTTEELNNNAAFMTDVIAWKTLTFEPTDILSAQKKEIGYYQAIILNVIGEAVEFSIIPSTLESYMKNITKLASEINKAGYEECISDAALSYHLDDELFDSLEMTKNLDWVARQNVYEKLAVVADYKIDQSYYDAINDGLETLSTVADVVKKVAADISITELSDDIKSLVDELYKNCPSSQYMMKTALSEIKTTMNTSLEGVLLGALAFTASDLADKLIKELLDDLWKDLVKATIGNLAAGVFIGQKIGETVCNMLFSTNEIIEQWFKLNALVHFEDLMYDTITILANRFKNAQTDRNARLFFTALQLLGKTYEEDYKMSEDLVEYVFEKGLINKIANGINQLFHWSGNSQVQQYHNDIKYLTDVLQDLYDITKPQFYANWHTIDLASKSQSNNSFNGKVISVHCPTDIEVADSNGNALVKIVNDSIEFLTPGIYVNIDNSEKEIVCSPNDTYTISISATDLGTMDYTITEIRDSIVARQVSYEDVPLVENQQFQSSINVDTNEDRADYDLKCQDGTVIEATFDSLPPVESNVIDVVVAEELFEGFSTELIDKVADAMFNMQSSVDISAYLITVDDVMGLFSAVQKYYPSEYSILSKTDFSYKALVSPSKGIVTGFRFYYDAEVSLSAYQKRVKDLQGEINKLVAQIEGMNDFEKALFVHDYIVLNCEYDNELLEMINSGSLDGEIRSERYTEYSVLVNGTGVCGSYALAYRAVLNAAGISCLYLSSAEMNHAWNLVKINGSWYHVDCCWDDPVPDTYGQARRTYFLLTDSEIMSLNHRNWTPGQYKATNETFSEMPRSFDCLQKYSNGSWYYMFGGSLYRSDVDGDNEKKIGQFAANTIAVDDEKVYYVSARNIYCYDIETNSTYFVYYLPSNRAGQDYSAATIRNLYADGEDLTLYVRGKDKDGSYQIWRFSDKLQTEKINSITGIALDKSELTLSVFDKNKLTANIISSSSMTDLHMNWSSSNSTVASVDNFGTVTGNNAGSAIITVECLGFTAKCSVRVNGDGLSGNCGDNITWQLNSNGTIEINGTGEMTDYLPSSSRFAPWYNVREKIQHLSVSSGITRIGNSTFCSCSNLVSVELPSSIESIGGSAFEGCVSLPSFVIPNGVSLVDGNLFSGCTNLAEVYIPNSVTTIWYEAFYGCSSLTEVELPKNLTTIRSGAFWNCTNLKAISFPDSLTTIENQSFYGCNSLTEIFIPGNINNIGNVAFANCKNLRKVDISNGVTSIGNSAFSGCISLTGIFIPESVSTIGSHVFLNCDNLIRIDVDENNPNYLSDSYGVLFNKEQTQLLCFPAGNPHKVYSIPEGVTKIDRYGFMGVKNLESISIPIGIKEINSETFENCVSLSNIDLPSSLSNIGIKAFKGCKSLTSIELPCNLTRIQTQAFSDCTGLIKIRIPGSVIYISDETFSGCSCLTRIDVEENNQVYSSDSFGVLFNKEQTSINCFPAGSSITSYQIPDSVTSIESYAFSGCIHLSSVRIPSNLTNIRFYAFYDCKKLTEIKIPYGIKWISSGTFYGCENLKTMTIPASVERIDMNAFTGCQNLKTMIIPANVEMVDLSAFAGCQNLEKILFQNSSCNFNQPIHSIDEPDEKTEFSFTIYGYSNSTAEQEAANYNLSFVPIDVDSHEHTFFLKDYEPKSENSDGREYWECYCEESGYEVIDHNYVETIIPATCETEGHVEIVCSGCGDTQIREIIPPLGHDWKETGRVIGNCSEPSVITYSCARCYETKTEEVELDKSHSLITVVHLPTCTEYGYTEDKCERCGESVVYDFKAPLGHSMKLTKTTENCTAHGSYIYFCSRCDYTEQVAVDKKNLVTETVIMPATCTAAGAEKQVCTLCGATVSSKIIPATGHEFDKEFTVDMPATCTSEGVRSRHCRNCEVRILAETIPELGHDFGEWKVTTLATCTEKGVETKYCSRCDATETREIVAIGHHYTAVVTKPTCMENGYTTYTCECGDSYVDDYVNALGHDFGEWKLTAPATCTEKGVETKYCSRCDATQTQEIAATGHHHTAVVTKPTCTEKGYTTYTCECGDSYVDDYVNALGHDLVHHDAKSVTCTADGWKAYDTCTRCDYSTYSEIYSTGHTPGVAIKEKEVASTCTVAGNYDSVVYCSVCGVEISRESIPIALAAHSYKNKKVVNPTAVKAGYNDQKCSGCGVTRTVCTAPTGVVKTVKCKARTANAETIYWSSIKGAQGYQIQISTKDGKKWDKTYNAKTKTSYTFKKLSSGGTYKFRVRIYAKGVDGKYYFGAWTKAITSPTLPSGTSLTKVTGGSKSFTAQWKQNKTVNGYQIQYSTNSKFTGAKTVTVKSNKTLKTTVKKLSAKKVYYVRIRTYKTISKVNYFSAWSKTYKVKTK